MLQETVARLAAKTGRPEDIVASRGFTADEFSVHIVTKVHGVTYRVASYRGSRAEAARLRMWQYHADTGRTAWLARGTDAAYLPLLLSSDWHAESAGE